ncbi:hypothetical protein [Marinibactrum halimedae]|uniref:Uncharacterized protein n=1 Tax=Marinibactrum halimedae TaxID=1444977 RepID=A0AA37WM46_9GAMM|nr:hypothetical protein [Marinibactrum halimedae]MCD9460458.1 hypothetical protein [Marinibactrum halimedae]GLS25865.1 hypothetical protein GCM10007877_15790 [Marinibactrum halimedae]
MQKEEIYDPNFWYVVNQHYKHIVYRSKDKSKALRYAERKNVHALESNMYYSVLSGVQVQSDNIIVKAHNM